MKIYFFRGDAFFEISTNYWLCIGTQCQVQNASPLGVMLMIQHALQLAQGQQQSVEHETKH